VPAVVLIFALALGVTGASSSGPPNWSTPGQAVVCGIARGIPGSAKDLGVGAPLRGLWPGLQCQTAGLPPARTNVGDPAVDLGQGRTGRARLVYMSQDDLLSNTPYRKLPAGSIWKRDGIKCAVRTASVRCTNSAGYGFTLSPGHLHVF
jgi:hypothetical protein